MVSQSFTIMGVSSSWMRRLLPEYLKSTKHTRKDYLELQQRRDQQSLQQQRQTTKKQHGEMNMKIMMMAAAAFLTAIAIFVGLKELTG
jgi:GrpB-like predicted nucleotidyltransferase (UPF0157 family)